MSYAEYVGLPTPPTEITIRVPGTVPLDPITTRAFRAFLQSMFERRAIGALRYGDRPTVQQKYMRRLELEFAAYKETGNAEHLWNIAVYAFLEFEAPQHPGFNVDMFVESVTRAELGGEIE